MGETIYRISLFVALLLVLTSGHQKTFGQSNDRGTFTDKRDGHVYKTVKIGDQWVMAENLSFKPAEGNYWAFGNDQNNVSKYGYLYDWETAKRVAPEGIEANC